MRGTGLWWYCKLYTAAKWIAAQLNVIAVTGFISVNRVTNPVHWCFFLSLKTHLFRSAFDSVYFIFLYIRHVKHLRTASWIGHYINVLLSLLINWAISPPRNQVWRTVLPHCKMANKEVMICLLELSILATSKVISDRVSVCTHGNFIVLLYWETKQLASWPNITLNHSVTLSWHWANQSFP